ncbi:hypothetical protein N7535_002869 [Penicillium sp. DV-2018c]|nr:hypothetical protein N7461_001446 [Penicillium sp. DV-2018c]KAJ5575943.1 hypothetical protein N7535_002869 [Penicillium sp. DV-2018c]
MPKSTFSDAEWRRLIKFKNSLESEEEELLAKVLRLRKQRRLLQKRAGDFIARKYEEISELEELERREAEERGRLEKDRAMSGQKECVAESARAAGEVPQSASLGNGPILAATSEDPILTPLLNDPSSDWAGLEASLFENAAEKSPSPVDGTVEPAGGSPSGAR